MPPFEASSNPLLRQSLGDQALLRGTGPVGAMIGAPKPVPGRTGTQPPSEEGNQFYKPPWYGPVPPDTDAIQRGRGPFDMADFVQPVPEMNSDTMGWMTNWAAAWAKNAKRFKHQLMDANQRYQLLITRREETPSTETMRRGEQSRRYVMLNVAAWNYFQAMREKMPASAADVPSAIDIWHGKAGKTDAWTVEGVVRYEEGDDDSGHHTPRGYTQGDERQFNSTVMGHQYTFNTWGTDSVETGTRLYLVLKKAPHRVDLDDYSVHPMRAMRRGRTDFRPGENITEQPFQLFYYADARYDTPPKSVLEYEDEFGNTHLGLAIYVGRVADSNITMKNPRSGDKPEMRVADILTKPMFYIFFGAE